MAKAVEVLQQEIGYSNVEALGETLQNIVNNNTAQQVEGLPSNEVAEKLNKAYQQLDLTSYSSEEIRRMIQFTFLKAAKEDGLQMNHQMTPDAIGLLVAYMIDQMTKKDEPLQIADFAAGSGNLLSTILLFLQSAGKTASATAIDNDEVLVHLALQAFALEQLDVKTSLQDGLQMNHQMTPDAIGLLVAYMIDQMTKKDEPLQIADFAAGSGNLLSTILLFLQSAGKTVSATAIDNDEVLVHLALQAFALEQLDVKTSLQDGLQDSLVDPQDFVVSDLPVGYYPVDANAARFETKNDEGHSFAHHLLIEQQVRYLKEAGVGFFIVPTNLFDTPEGEKLLSYLQKETYVQAMLAFPRNLFKDVQFSKSLLIVQKRGKGAKQVSQVLLGDIPEFKNREKFRKFTLTFEKWVQEML